MYILVLIKRSAIVDDAADHEKLAKIEESYEVVCDLHLDLEARHIAIFFSAEESLTSLLLR